MSRRPTIAASALSAALAAAVALAGTAASAQQQGGDQQRDQTRQSGGASAQQAEQGTDGAAEREAAGPLVVLDFSARQIASDDAFSAISEMADEPHAAKLAVSADRAASGVLVFDDIEAFSDWRQTAMADFFEPLGPVESVDISLQIYRPGLLRLSDPERLADGFGRAVVEYVNKENDAAGDSDIDAQTVFCAPGASCSPSN